MKLDINLIWAVVVLIVSGIAGAYSLNKQKLEKFKLSQNMLNLNFRNSG